MSTCSPKSEHAAALQGMKCTNTGSTWASAIHCQWEEQCNEHTHNGITANDHFENTARCGTQEVRCHQINAPVPSCTGQVGTANAMASTLQWSSGLQQTKQAHVRSRVTRLQLTKPLNRSGHSVTVLLLIGSGLHTHLAQRRGTCRLCWGDG